MSFANNTVLGNWYVVLSVNLSITTTNKKGLSGLIPDAVPPLPWTHPSFLCRTPHCCHSVLIHILHLPHLHRQLPCHSQLHHAISQFPSSHPLAGFFLLDSTDSVHLILTCVLIHQQQHTDYKCHHFDLQIEMFAYKNRNSYSGTGHENQLKWQAGNSSSVVGIPVMVVDDGGVWKSERSLLMPTWWIEAVDYCVRKRVLLVAVQQSKNFHELFPLS